jgi:hypothetical protein
MSCTSAPACDNVIEKENSVFLHAGTSDIVLNLASG